MGIERSITLKVELDKDKIHSFPDNFDKIQVYTISLSSC